MNLLSIKYLCFDLFYPKLSFFLNFQFHNKTYKGKVNIMLKTFIFIYTP